MSSKHSTRYRIGQQVDQSTLIARTGVRPHYRYEFRCQCGVEFTLDRVNRRPIKCRCCKAEDEAGRVRSTDLASTGQRIAMLGLQIAQGQSAISELKQLVKNL